MPRIVPLQLLKCLKVLLDDNGGILSAGEVKRIAGLMTKYSKKLVSKCIYVQILKCTKTELLDEFMGVGGWSLVYSWLNDGIRSMNWPLVQEILELLLLCPVDVHRLKINSAPKLVKGLCKDGGNEGVRILAKRLVEQWLKIVTENSMALAESNTVTQQPAQSTVSQSSHVTSKNQSILSTSSTNSTLESIENGSAAAGAKETAVTPTKADEKNGLVYKIVMGKNGKSVLAKIAKTVQPTQDETQVDDSVIEEDESQSGGDDIDIDDEKTRTEFVVVDSDAAATSKLHNEIETTSEDSSSQLKSKLTKMKVDDKNSFDETDDVKSDKRERKSSKDSKDKENKTEKDKKSLSSSSSSHKSSHKHSSKSSSSSSKSKTTSSSSSSSSSGHRSSSEKHRSEKERSSSSKDKDKDRKENSNSNLSTNKHKSSSHKSSSSSSSNSKDRHRDKDKEKEKDKMPISSLLSSSSSTNLKKDRDREKEAQAEKDKDTLAKVTPTTLQKLAKIPKKPKDESESDGSKPTSITIPSKKASISIEIRRDTDKTKTVKTYNSQFRSHGLTEEAPKPPSRKDLKKPNSASSTTGLALPSSLPSALKRPTSPPAKDAPSDKKTKVDLNNTTIPNEKPGAIKLIPPKKIQTLVETNLFSDALSAATGPKKTVKRKRTVATSHGKEGPSPPTSPDAPKVAPLKFYQDTLESKGEGKSDKSHEESASKKLTSENNSDDKENNTNDDDDDIPLKKVKEDIEKQVERERKLKADGSKDLEDENDVALENVVKVPGPGCGPNGPPGVLMIHRRKGPKKKLSWKPQEELEEIRFFEIDETERVNVTKTSFNDMKNLERFNERDALFTSRRGLEDNMESQTAWKTPLVEVEDVPPHPDGASSEQRKIQMEREASTLRALYFSTALIPDSPTEAEIEPHYQYDIPIIPLDDITGNQDAINDYTSMPWPEPKTTQKDNDVAIPPTSNNVNGINMDLFSSSSMTSPNPFSGSPFNPFSNSTNTNINNIPNSFPQINMQMPQVVPPPPNWPTPPLNTNSILGNPFTNNNMDILHGSLNVVNPNPHFMGGGQQFGPNQFISNNPQFAMNGFNNGPNFNGPPPLIPNLTSVTNSIGGGGMGPIMNGSGPSRGPGGGGGNMRNNNNNGGGNWRMGGSNFQDNNNGGGNNWRSAGPGQNRPNNMNGNNNNGICKAFMRGHCRNGKSCKYIHPKNNKRI